jgi:hypothetical protein
LKLVESGGFKAARTLRPTGHAQAFGVGMAHRNPAWFNPESVPLRPGFQFGRA